MPRGSKSVDMMETVPSSTKTGDDVVPTPQPITFISLDDDDASKGESGKEER